MTHSNITIIGAGPGGVATALFLSKSGIPCTVIDRAVFPRDKICGDAISGKVVEVMNRYDPSLIDRLIDSSGQIGSWGVDFVAPNLEKLKVPFRKEFDKQQEKPPGFISRRTVFDHFLVDELKRRDNIRVIEGVEINDYSRRQGQWECTGPGGFQHTTQLLIMANGAQSNFSRKIAGLEIEPAHYCAGIRGYYKGVRDLSKDNFIELHFLKDFLPGYFWIFPLPDGYANVGVGMRKDKVSAKKVNLKKRLFEIIHEVPSLKERFKDAKREGPVQGFGLPLGSKKRKISGEGYLLVGDAAHLIDPFTGEGIGNAMVSGQVAAEIAKESLKAENWSAGHLREYDRRVYNRLWSELNLSRRMQQLLNYPWLFNLVVKKANRNKVLGETISCMFDDLDVRQKLKQPSFYFKLLFN